MVEKVLILVRPPSLSQEMRSLLKRFQVDIVDASSNEAEIAFGELDVRYNMIIIDKLFSGNGRETSKLVRRIRKEFFNPIIGIDTMSGSGYLYSLQIAGCNVTLSLTGCDNKKICDEVCERVAEISKELAEPYQQVV